MPAQKDRQSAIGGRSPENPTPRSPIPIRTASFRPWRRAGVAWPARPCKKLRGTGLRKTSVTREFSEGRGGQARGRLRPPPQNGRRPDNSSLHDVKAGRMAGGKKSENRTQPPDSVRHRLGSGFRFRQRRFFLPLQPRQSGNRSGRQNHGMVEPDGIEPTTSCLQSRRSPN